ncbi:MAG: hypothetical protein A4E32_01186 [Methanomassiliicoccales archaeon PtaU1.Bin124]|nr:MAG: hypothetical protein A4E32_01186 [Methanomassiliicoccales archaeon PtaU1.Bin124]
MNMVFSRKPLKFLTILMLIQISLFLWIISSVSIHTFSPDSFYYVTQMPIIFWVGLAIWAITLSFKIKWTNLFSKNISHIIDLCLLLLIILFLFGLPCFIYDNYRFSDSLKVINDVNNLISSGQFILSGELNYLSSAPGFHLFSANISIITDTSVFDIAKYYPIFIFVLICIVLYSIAIFFSAKYAIFAPIMFLGLSWTQEYHFAPQSFAIILYSFFIYVIIKNWNEDSSSYKYILIMLIMIFSITISHLGTPLFVILNILFIIILFSISKKRSHNLTLKSVPSFNLLILNICVWVSWLIYISDGIMSLFINLVTNSINNLLLGEVSLSNSIASNPTYDFVVVSDIRIVIGIIQILLGFAMLFFFRKNIKLATILGGIFLGSFSFAILSPSLGGLYFGRSFIFSSIIVSIMFIAAIKYFPRPSTKIFFNMIICFIIITLFLIPVTHYAGDGLEFISDSQLQEKMYAECLNISLYHPTTYEIYNNIYDNKYYSYSTAFYNYYYQRMSAGDIYNKYYILMNHDIIYNNNEFRIYD